jgi:hypothetical protein
MAEKPLSLRAFAKRLGVSQPAVTKAIKAGRLVHAVGHNAKGQPQIIDFDLGRQEWNANAAKPTRVPPPATEDDQAEPGKDTLNEAQRLLTLEKLREKRIAIDVRLGQLVEKKAVAKILFEGDRILREQILNLPARLAPELAAETDVAKIQLRLDAAIRQALSATADRYGALASA